MAKQRDKEEAVVVGIERVLDGLLSVMRLTLTEEYPFALVFRRSTESPRNSLASLPGLTYTKAGGTTVLAPGMGDHAALSNPAASFVSAECGASILHS